MEAILKTAHERLNSIATKNSLLDYVRWLDLEYDKDNKDDGLPRQIITRSIIAVGPLLTYILDEQPTKRIKETIKWAANYALYPNKRNYDIYFAYATDSFPFGDGQGCHGLLELRQEGSNPCGPGTGCRSGAGSMFHDELDYKITFQTIAEDLIPWITDDHDPVLKREIEKI